MHERIFCAFSFVNVTAVLSWLGAICNPVLEGLPYPAIVHRIWCINF